MPYIPDDQRDELDDVKRLPRTPGELGYLIAAEISSYLSGKRLDKGSALRFSDYNEVLGVLESAKLEYYRRVIAPYEDGKLKVNGDVFYVLERL